MVSKPLAQRCDERRVRQGRGPAEEPDQGYRPRRLRSRPERRGEKGKAGGAEECTALDQEPPWSRCWR